MRKGWEYKKLGEVLETTSGGTPSKSHKEYYEGGTIPWLRSGEVSKGDIYDAELYITEEGLKKSSAKLFPIDTVLIAMYGATVGQVGILKSTMCTNQAICGILPNKDFHPNFLKYVLLANKKNYLKQAIGGAQPNISQQVIKSTYIPIVKFSEQESVVSELDKINELIRLKKEQLKDFDNLAQSLFYEMFGEGKCLRKKLKDIVKIQSGQVSPLEEPYSEMIHVGPANIESNTGRLLNLKTAKEENLISGKYLFNSSMVLYSKIRPNLNKVTIPSFEGICSADMYPIIPLECIDKNFLLFLLKQKEFLTYAISNSGRANIPKINREALLNYEAILPPLSLQRLFAQRIEQIEREKSEVQKSIQDLETLLASRMQYWFE